MHAETASSPTATRRPARPLAVLAGLLALLVTLAAPLPTPADALPDGSKLADFEGGVPGGWFVFNGPASTVATPTTAVGSGDATARFAQVGDNEVLEATFDVGDFGGFGQDLAADGAPDDWRGTEGMSFWFHGTGSGLTYQAEIADNRSDPGLDTAERFDVEFTDDTAGWRRVDLPWSAWSRATDFQPGGAPDDGLTLSEVWSWAIVLPGGADTVLFDDVDVDDRVVIDYEDGLPPNDTDPATGVTLGYSTFSDGGSPVSIALEDTPPAPDSFEFGPDNSALALTATIGSFAGFIELFNEGGTWTPQDWSAYEGFTFWLHGQGSGTALFVDLAENRVPGSTGDTAERWSYALVDDFTGWRQFHLPFEDFFRKDIGNGAPNDGFTRTEMHGWAFGGLSTGGDEQTWHLDDVALYGSAGSIPLSVAFSQGVFDVTEGEVGEVGVRLNRAMVPDDDPVTVNWTTEPYNAIPDREYTPTSGSFTFLPDGPREQTFTVETFDDDKFEGDERVVLRLSEPTGAELGTIRQASLMIRDDDPFDPLLLDDFEREPRLWDASDDVSLDRVELTDDDAMAVPDQGPYEGVLAATVPTTGAPLLVEVEVQGSCPGGRGRGVTTVVLYGSETLPVSAIDLASLRIDGAGEHHTDKRTGTPRRHAEDVDGDGLDDLVLHLRLDGDEPTCDGVPATLDGATTDGRDLTLDPAEAAVAAFGRDFAGPQDWSDTESLTFWWYGAGTGDEVVVEVLDNEAPDPGPSGWELAWSDEFDQDAGTPANPDNWGYELGDVTPDGKNGWGNEERQYYTDSTDNVRHDGEGNLEIVLRAADGDLECWYGTCEYTSGRLLSWHRQEFQYGRFETRLKVPEGSGLWPAFWSLGTDIDANPWPAAGEIDFMEYVGRLPEEIFGTIHGPGYSGGASFGNEYQFGTPVHEDWHTFTVDWQPGLIEWYVDGILYHTATPEDVAPNPWVFDKPFFLLLNQAIGGNFGGAIDPDIDELLPATYEIDYVRVSQAPDTAERFEASFVDDVAGWREVTIPFTDLARSADQPEGAPDDGLTLSAVNGYGFRLPDGLSSGQAWMDQVRLDPAPPPTEVVVTSAADSGAGSLREAVARVAPGGTITFDPSLAGESVLLSGPLTLSRDVTIDASAAPGFTLDGQAFHRGLVVDAGVTATVSHLAITNGYGFQLGGGVLNNGDLTLDHVRVVGNTMTTDAGDFWQGGAGIYTGENGALTLVDSTVADNDSGWAGGGLYGFFGSSTTIVRSTISGNVAADVGGGIRSLGDVTITNSTISGNTSTAWHGGGIFATDGTVAIVHSTIADNAAPAGFASELMVATFGAPVTVDVTGSVIDAGGTYACQVEGDPGVAVLTVDAATIASDGSCDGATVADPLLGPLADNGGPTATHALDPASPAVDVGGTDCPTTDQRGVARDAACDAGAYELT